MVVVAVRGVRILVTVGVFAVRAGVAVIWQRAWSRGRATAVVAGYLSRLCESLGPTFIKGGQLLSTRADLLAPAVIEQLRRLQDQVVSVPAAGIRREIARGLGAEGSARLRDVEWTPIATGSIAQVHRARLEDGRVVAVKVRRPGIAASMRADVRLLRVAASAASALRLLGTIPLVSLVDAIAEPLLEQLDFRIEAANNRRLQRLFGLAEGVRIPALVEELCDETVLVMEYMQHLQTITSDDLSVEARQAAALAGLRALYRMIFLEGFVHADMHEGNVFLRAWGELVILDTGFVARMTTATRLDFIDFFFGLAGGVGLDCARIILERASSVGPGFDERGFCADMERVVASHAGRDADHFNLSFFVAELFGIQRRWQVRGSTDFIMTVVAMLVFEGVCKQLYPGCDFQAEARGFLIVGRSARQTLSA